MFRFSPVNRSLVVEDIVRQIQSLIVSGQLQKGDRLPPELELTAKMGVGRNALREALRTLEAQGWIHRSRGGTKVMRSERELLVQPLANVVMMQGIHVAELFELRRVLEGELAAMAAGRAMPEEIAVIEREAARLADPSLNDAAYIEVNVAFHMAVARAAHNRLLSLLLDSVRHLLVSTLTRGASVPEMRVHAIAAHAAIGRAIARHDAAGAREAMRRHLTEVEMGLRSHSEQMDGPV